MIQELFSWLDAQRITYIPVDTEVVDIPGFGRLFTADLSGVESIRPLQTDCASRSGKRKG